jgi:isoquinoline 1-oxidoreductase
MKHADANGNPSRRGFLALSGSGLFVFFAAEPLRAFQQPGVQGYPSDWNAYLRVGADGRVTCFTGKVELGQGTTTSLAQLLAEELDVAFDSVDMVMADTDLCPWDRATVGSLGIWQFGPVLRAAGAEARAVLLQMAAERLGAPADRLRVKDGVVADSAAPDKRVTYAQLAGGQRIERHLAGTPLKAPSTYRIAGQSPRRKDATDKVTGRAKYSADVILPGMLHARLVRPPALGARLKSADTSAAEKLLGVRVIRDEGRIAVLHARPDIADQALKLVKAEFDPPPPGPDDKTIFDHLLKNAPTPSAVAEKGSLADGEKLAAAVVAQRYLNGYVAHAVIETYSAMASIEGSKVTVWASTQAPFRVKQEVAQGLGVPPESVRVISTYVGGAFGGKCHGTPPVEAARLARISGRPVQVVFDRAEEFLFGALRPAAVVDVRSGLTGAGKLAFWDFRAYGGGPQEAQTFYDVPHQRTVSAGSWDATANPPGLHPLGVGVWRAPAGATNTFARESHMDMLAAKAGADPVDFRLANLTDKRMRRLLEAAAERFAWRSAKAPSGRGVGVSCGIYTGTYMVTMAQVAVERKTGRVKIGRIVFAHDQGRTASPEGTRQQIEGAVIMGLGYALSEEVRFRNGEVLSRSFDSYEIPRYSWLPKIEIALLDSPEAQVSGCGEPPVINLGAVVANAIFDAVGARMPQLPMTPERVLAALGSTGAGAGGKRAENGSA